MSDKSIMCFGYSGSSVLRVYRNEESGRFTLSAGDNEDSMQSVELTGEIVLFMVDQFNAMREKISDDLLAGEIVSVLKSDRKDVRGEVAKIVAHDRLRREIES